MIGDSRNNVGLSPGQIVRHVDLEIRSFVSDRGFEKRCWTEPRPDCETRGPRDREIGGSELHLLASVLLLCVLLLLLRRCGIWLWVSCAFFWIFCVAVGGVDGSGI